MNTTLDNKWKEVIGEEFTKPYFTDIEHFLEDAYESETVFPKVEDIFNALKWTDYDQVKVVILGQDPYHDDNQAHGLSFSVLPGVKTPPSLRNIYKELEADCGCYIPNHGCLTSWAKQGVLLLNAVLTVQAHAASSHKKIGWQTFTDQIIKSLNDREEPVVFILWGNYAKSKEQYITNLHHKVIKSVHPSPLSARRGFFGSKPFSTANSMLIEWGKEAINWQIDNLEEV